MLYCLITVNFSTFNLTWKIIFRIVNIWYVYQLPQKAEFNFTYSKHILVFVYIIGWALYCSRFGSWHPFCFLLVIQYCSMFCFLSHMSIYMTHDHERIYVYSICKCCHGSFVFCLCTRNQFLGYAYGQHGFNNRLIHVYSIIYY